MKKRFLKAAGCVVLFLIAGLGYAAFVQKTGWAIPCLFREVTGYLCPGCGVTRMCLSMLQLDFAAAFSYNPALFLLLPIFAVIFVPYVAGYIRSGKWELSRAQNRMLYVCIAALLVFGVARNFV